MIRIWKISITETFAIWYNDEDPGAEKRAKAFAKRQKAIKITEIKNQIK